MKTPQINKKLLICGFLTFLFPALSFANPQGFCKHFGDVSARYSADGKTLNINQASSKGIIHWDSFSIARNEVTNFNNAGGVTLNRVGFGISDINKIPVSDIQGALRASGGVILLNPAGIVFHQGAIVDVGSLIASSLDLSDEDFKANRYFFSASTARGVVSNYGSIKTAKDYGMLALVGPRVENYGRIVARLGSVVLAGGAVAKSTIAFGSFGLINFQVNLGNDVAALDKHGKIVGRGVLMAPSAGVFADGGYVLISASGASKVLDNVINMQGYVQADTVFAEPGRVVISAGQGGGVAVSGSINARGLQAGQVGGSVHVLGETIHLTEKAIVNVSGQAGGGEVLIGGDKQGKNIAVQNSQQTTIDKGAKIFANGYVNNLGAGSGGRVVVWSNGSTFFMGYITAQGGFISGDGGWVEVSGKKYLNYAGTTNLLSLNGKLGKLLLDPDSIEIIVAGGGFPLPALGASTLSPSAILAILATADLQLLANDFITVDADIIASTQLGALTLKTLTGEIVVNALININGNLTFIAGSGLSIFNDIRSAGSIILHATDGISVGADRVFSAGQDINIFDNLSSEGDFNLTAGRNINIMSSVGCAGAMSVNAGDSLNITSTKVSSGVGEKIINASLESEGDMSIVTANDVNVFAGNVTLFAGIDGIIVTSSISAGGDLMLTAGRDVKVATGSATLVSNKDIILTSSIAAGGSVSIIAARDISVVGGANSNLSSGGMITMASSIEPSGALQVDVKRNLLIRAASGGLSLSAAKDITLSGAFGSGDDMNVEVAGLTQVMGGFGVSATSTNGKIAIAGSMGSAAELNLTTKGDVLLQASEGSLLLNASGAIAGETDIEVSSSLGAASDLRVNADGFLSTLFGPALQVPAAAKAELAVDIGSEQVLILVGLKGIFAEGGIGSEDFTLLRTDGDAFITAGVGSEQDVVIAVDGKLTIAGLAIIKAFNVLRLEVGGSMFVRGNAFLSGVNGIYMLVGGDVDIRSAGGAAKLLDEQGALSSEVLIDIIAAGNIFAQPTSLFTAPEINLTAGLRYLPGFAIGKDGQPIMLNTKLLRIWVRDGVSAVHFENQQSLFTYFLNDCLMNPKNVCNNFGQLLREFTYPSVLDQFVNWSSPRSRLLNSKTCRYKKGKYCNLIVDKDLAN